MDFEVSGLGGFSGSWIGDEGVDSRSEVDEWVVW